MRYRFNDCDIDLIAQELLRNGSPVRIEPQVFDLLVYLVENQGKLIGHDDLLQSVWRGRLVSDSAIASRISAVRKAVGDNGKSQRIIKTVARKGFKFLPAVEKAADEDDDNQPVAIAPIISKFTSANPLMAPELLTPPPAMVRPW
jgi:DNA-binding winged helix-turn-helix (wHTH) protein